MEQSELTDSKDRASARINFFLTTDVTSEQHGTMGARVRNLSAGGMMIEFGAEPDPDLCRGDPVVAQLRGIGKVRGEIAWGAGRRFGIKFSREVDPELARKPVVAGESTPDYAKPVIVVDRAVKYPLGPKGW
jgi:hypothetical protein